MFMATLRFLICETNDWMLDVCFSCDMEPRMAPQRATKPGGRLPVWERGLALMALSPRSPTIRKVNLPVVHRLIRRIYTNFQDTLSSSNSSLLQVWDLHITRSKISPTYFQGAVM
jgi:hypothetical protein